MENENPEALLFLAIQARILEQVPEIKYIDQNLGQYMHEDFKKQILSPAVLVDFPVTDFSEMQGNNQFGAVTIVVTLFYDVWNHTNNLTPTEVKQAGLQYLAVNQKLFIALQGWSPDNCEALNRTQSKGHNANETGMRVKETTFTTQFEDRSCDDDSQTIQLSLRTE